MIIVADSSALVALATCGSLWVLKELFNEVKVPQAVFDEVVVPNKPQAQTLRIYLEDKVETVDLSQVILKNVNGIGQGELEAMALAMNLSANRLLIDDAKAKKVALLNQIKVIGSLGILLLAKQQNLLDELKPLLESINQSDIYISKRLVTKVLILAGEIESDKRA